jgi:hypothetical protein
MLSAGAALTCILVASGCAGPDFDPTDTLKREPGARLVRELTSFDELPPNLLRLVDMLNRAPASAPELPWYRAVLEKDKATWAEFLSRRAPGDHVFEVFHQVNQMDYVLFHGGAEVARVTFEPGVPAKIRTPEGGAGG